jgi:RES domain-containing protein
VLSRAVTARCVRGDVRSLGTITWEDIEERSLTELTLARSLKLADLTERSVVGRYGVAGDISTGTDYGPSRKLAGRLYELGFDGIYYTARHDPAFLERGVAVFGGSGDQKLFATSTTAIPEALVDQAAREFGLLVLPSL